MTHGTLLTTGFYRLRGFHSRFGVHRRLNSHLETGSECFLACLIIKHRVSHVQIVVVDFGIGCLGQNIFTEVLGKKNKRAHWHK
jgi:hypothetical protein